MKYFSMIGLLDEEMLSRFIEFYNQGHEEIRIVLNTNGGGAWVTSALVEMINSCPKASIVIFAAFSSGLELCLNTKCPKILTNSSRAMWHYGTREMFISDKNKPTYYEDECIVSNLPYALAKSERIAKMVMNKSEMKKFKKEQDVYFNYERLKEIFPDAVTLL